MLLTRITSKYNDRERLKVKMQKDVPSKHLSKPSWYSFINTKAKFYKQQSVLRQKSLFTDTKTFHYY